MDNEEEYFVRTSANDPFVNVRQPTDFNQRWPPVGIVRKSIRVPYDLVIPDVVGTVSDSPRF